MSSAKILLIEDDADIRLGLQIRLEANGNQVITRGSAIEGLKAAVFEKPDLIILDLGLPDMNGFEVLKYLQTKPETKSLPVIILTAQGTTENFTKGMSADNVVTFLEKPVSNDELIGTVRIALESKK